MDKTEEQITNPQTPTTAATPHAGLSRLYATRDSPKYRARFVAAGQVRTCANLPANIIVEPEALQQGVMEGKFK